MNSPFTMMANTLVYGSHGIPAPAPRQYVPSSNVGRYNGRTAALRAKLDHGSFTAQELAQLIGLPDSGRVYALLRNDVRKGSVVLRDGVYRKVRNVI